MATGDLRDNDRDLAVYLQRELGMSDGMLQGSDKAVMGRVWKTFRKRLLGARVKRNFNSETLAELLDASNKTLEIDWPERLRLKTMFVTKGVALGSQAFVEKASRSSQRRWATAATQSRGSAGVGRGLLLEKAPKVDRMIDSVELEVRS
jgi:hypothetical protein